MNHILLIFLMISLLSSCTQRITADDLYLVGSQYYSQGQPYTGTVSNYFSSGELEGELAFDEGVLSSTTAFDYAGEEVGTSQYTVLEASDNIATNVIRVVEVESNEGEVQYRSLLIIVDSDIAPLNCHSMALKIKNQLRDKKDSYDCIAPCKVSIVRGELEEQTCVSSGE